MQHFRPTLVFKPHIPLPSILYLLPHHRLLLLAVSLHLLLPLHSLTFSRLFNGMLAVSESRVLNCHTFFCLIPLTLSVFRNLTITHLPLSGSLDSLRSDRTHSRSFILSRDATHASGEAIIFVRQGLSFSELSTSSPSLLDPYCDYVGVNISLSNFSLSFLNVYAPLFRSFSTNGRTNSFSPSILPSSRNLFILRDFNCHHPLWDSRSISDLRGEKVFDRVIFSDLLPLNDPDIPTLSHHSSGSHFYPDISFAPSSLALSCSLEVF